MRKLTIEYIKEQFAKEGYELLSKNYEGCHNKLKYFCPNKHKHQIAWNEWKKGQKCPYCAGQGKLTIGFIRSEFKKERYILLTTEYENNRQKLEYICPNGHRHSIKWNNWQRVRDVHIVLSCLVAKYK